MRKTITAVALIFTTSFAGVLFAEDYPVTAPPPGKYADFYQKITYAGPFPILSSGKTSDYALKEAAYLIKTMLAKRPDILQTLADNDSRLAIMAHDEFTNDIPEHKTSLTNSKNSPDWWDRRARGLGGSKTLAVASCGEENLLAFPGDPYHAENIFIHEFAHMIHLRGVNNIDPTFNGRLKKAFDEAKAAGLWKDKYAGTFHTEYFAEGVQSWFNDNREDDHDHNHVNTRAELIAYDPGLADLCHEVFRDTKLTYIKPPLRKTQAHLTGYDYAQSPTFAWPERLKNIDILPARAKKTSASTPTKSTRPNILFIAIDDLRPELGCYGAKHILSPNIDRFAKSALLFNRAYCQQSVCNPSRASLLTGLRPDTTQVLDLRTNLRDKLPNVLTLPEHFKNHGYHTVAMGKIYHNTFPDPPSWSIPKLKPTGHRNYSPQTQKTLNQQREDARNAGMTDREISNRIRGPAVEIQDVPDHQRHDGALTQLAINQLQTLSQSKSNKPFFLAVGFILPHLPWNPPKKYFDLYDRAKLPLAPNPFLPTNSPAVAMGDRSFGGMYELRDTMHYRKAPNPFEGSLPEADQRKLRHAYFASVTFVDTLVGRILDQLKSLNLDDNTVVVLWGDHGWKLGDHNSWAKQTNYEIDTRVPLIIRQPNAKANGQTTNALVEFVDLFPTLCHLAKLPLPNHLEGDNLAPLFDDPTNTVKSAAFSQFPRNHDGRKFMGYTLRTDQHRYVEWIDTSTAQTHATELYDHNTDPLENTNIASLPANKQLVKALRKQLFESFTQPQPEKR